MLIEIVITILLVLFIWNYNKKPANYPPGPWGLPLVGHIPLNLTKLPQSLSALRKEHKDVFSWRIGSRLYVFLCNYKVVKESYQNVLFADRPNSLFLTLLVDGNKIGVLGTNGPRWMKIRRFIMRHLRDLGMGKSKMESIIHYEASEFVRVMKQQAGKAAPIPRALSVAIINNLWQLVASKRYEMDDKFLIDFEHLLHNFQESLGPAMLLDVFPWLEYILPSFLLNKIMKLDIRAHLSNLLKQILQADIDQHAATLDVNNPRDFIDDYLVEMDKQKSDPESTMSNDDLIGCLADLFFAGFETSNLTICYGILYAAKFKDVQKRLQKEIDEVLSDEPVSLEDKSRLPYMEAFIHETLRFSSLIPEGAFRSVSADTTIAGYTVPKNAVVLATIEDIHYDPKHFDSPKEFLPERFLNSQGNFELPKEGFLPFGIGKRQCLGESLARMQIFIFFTTIFQHLEFSAPPGMEIDLRPKNIPLFNQPRMHQSILINLRK